MQNQFGFAQTSDAAAVTDTTKATDTNEVSEEDKQALIDFFLALEQHRSIV